MHGFGIFQRNDLIRSLECLKNRLNHMPSVTHDVITTSRNSSWNSLYVLRQYCRPFKIRDSPLYLYLGKTEIRVFDLKSLVRMRPKHFSCKCTTKRNPIFVNWSCNARGGGDDHRQYFFVLAFAIISQLSQLLRFATLSSSWRTLPFIYPPFMGSFILSRIYHISRKKKDVLFLKLFRHCFYISSDVIDGDKTR